MLTVIEPSISEKIAHQAIDASAKSGLPLAQLREWLTEHRDGLRSGSSDCPPSALRLIRELQDLGIDVVMPRCLDCNKLRKTLHNRVTGGRVCMTCYLDRGAEQCSRCDSVGHVSKRETDGKAVCHQCRLVDPTTWRPCGVCGELSQPMTTTNGVTLGKCCYVQPTLRCTVCGIRKGLRPHKTRRPVCEPCGELPRTPCMQCGLDAHTPIDGEPAVCARCTEHPPSPCSKCATLTVARAGSGEPRCYDCYERESRPCGRCGRVRTIVRLARNDDPDLCGICWKGPVMTCEGCGRIGPCRGERKGKMLCINCRPRRPQVCSHCGGDKRPPMAHWPEGPVCQPCYNRALAAKADCPICGVRRRLRHYEGFDSPVCSDCAGQPATHVCSDCGTEEWLYEKGVCPRCVLRSRLTELLGDESERDRSGMAPLFDALIQGRSPRAVIDWLLKSKGAVSVIKRMSTGELPLTYETLDALDGELGLGTVRHIEHLLTSTGTLTGRDSVLAATERWCTEFLAGVEHTEHAQLLQTYTRWQLLRPLRARAAREFLTDTGGYSVRARLKTVSDFGDFLVGRERSIAICRQGDLDDWSANEPAHRSITVGTFAKWAMARKAMPMLDVPTRPNDVPVVPADTNERWAVARRLLHEPGLDNDLRLAGALIVIYAQRLHMVSNLRVENVESDDGKVFVTVGEARIELPEPLDGYARQVLAERRPHPNKAKLVDDPGWLFPGVQPGRPINAQSLSKKLRRHGIASHRNRIAALYQLAGEIPAPLLADLLGISPRTAELWSRLASKGWAEYPAMRDASS